MIRRSRCGEVAAAVAGVENPPMRDRPALWYLDVVIKLVMVALLAFGAFSGLQQFEGKAFGGRLVFYPIAVLVLPVAWRFLASGRPFPYLADVLITLPFLIDVAGNAADLYDTVEWWDDANHFVNWALLSGGAGLLIPPARIESWALAGLVIGFGTTSAIGWELMEYLTFIRDSPEFATAYADTLGDLALGTLGSGVAAVLVARRPR
jgi:hypothetical protein